MRFLLDLSRCLLLFCAVATVSAQEGDSLDTVTVTGSRIAYSDLLETPAVALVRAGDHLLLPFTLFNDSRDETLRRQELHGSIKKLLDAGSGRFDLIFAENYVGRLNPNNYRVPISDDSKRPDASRVALAVRVPIPPQGARGDELISQMQAFLRSVDAVGRTEIEPASETALSINKPERFRYDLIAAIAKDSAEIGSRLNAGCTVALDGLNGRVQWERVSATDVLLYIPYAMQISGCAALK